MDFLGQVRQILDFQIFSIGDNPVTLQELVVATLIMFVARLISRFLRKALQPLADRARPVIGDKPVNITLRTLNWIILLLGVVVALNTIGVSMSSLSGIFTAGAVVTVAIGFAMQNIAQNFVSGAILATERSIKAGDVIEVEGSVLRVQNMGIRTTVARTRDDEEIIIPNATLVQNAVKNFTYQDSIYRLRGTVGVAYSSDMRAVMDILMEAAESLEWRSQAKRPLVFMKEFGSSSVDFEVSVWINDPWRAPILRSKLMESIWFALLGAGVTIAFPQMDLHLDPEVVARLGGARRESDTGAEPQ
jgi:small-conductance mechanosensitive channel